MNKWYNLAFVGVCALVLVVLLMAPEVTTPRLPTDDTHANRKDFAACPSCHMDGGEGPTMATDHLSGDKLKGTHQKCYLCHKRMGD